MAMFCYNPKLYLESKGKDGLKLESERKSWQAKLDGSLLVIMKLNGEECIQKTYYLDTDADSNSFRNYSGLVAKDETDIWYSFDPNTNNFHIVPDEAWQISEGESLYSVLKTTLTNIGCALSNEKEYLGSKRNPKGRFNRDLEWNWFGGNANIKFVQTKCNVTKNHQLIWTDALNYQYLLSFNRLWCDADHHIHNNFGQVQFMRYRITDRDGSPLKFEHLKNINWNHDHTSFQMMYPAIGEDGEGRFDPDSKHLSYNAPFTINDCPVLIANAFTRFIVLGELATKGKIGVGDIPQIMKTYCDQLKCNLPDPTTPTI